MESFRNIAIRNIAIGTGIPRLFMIPRESARLYQSDIWNVQLSQVGLFLGRVRHNIHSWLPGGDKNNANTTSASASASTSVNMSAHMADTLEQLEWTVLVTVCGRQVDGRTDGRRHCFQASNLAISCQPSELGRLSPKKHTWYVYTLYVSMCI